MRSRLFVQTVACVLVLTFLSCLTLWSTNEVTHTKESRSLVSSTAENRSLPQTVVKGVLTASREWCRPLHFLADPRNRPTTALVSFPGSGNTWLRYLIQQASGVNTGSQYFDKNLWRNGFPGEPWKDGRVAVVKTHEWGPKIRSQFQKAVLLIRNPGPAILAEFNRQGSGDNHTGLALPDLFHKENGTFWQKYVDTHLHDWQLTNLDWLKNFTGPLHVVRYESLCEALGPTLRDTLHFLDLPFDEESLQCAAARSEGAHKRPARQDQFDPYTQHMIEKLLPVQELVLQEVQQKVHNSASKENNSKCYFPWTNCFKHRW